jgi:uncharacterized protein (TIGR03032 family)
MERSVAAKLSARWETHARQWRDPADILSQAPLRSRPAPELLRFRVTGSWWDVVADTGATLLVTREYEHLVLALQVDGDRPAISYLPLPHPSGLVVDRSRGRVYIAATRNPNQVYELAAMNGLLPRSDLDGAQIDSRPLVPVTTRYFPGSTYLHDLALIGDDLHGNAVGQNAIVRLDDGGRAVPVWWPACIEVAGRPIFERNHLQLNSIAAGPDLAGSFFSASTDRVGRRLPGHRNFPVDGRGVVFSGLTREPVVRGLTRPHSARQHQGRVWVDDSGYGRVGVVADGRFEPVTTLPGWTRGLSFCNHIAFVGTSRVIPRFRQYAPGLDLESTVCGIHAIDINSGSVLGSIRWPAGNQIFAIDWLPRESSTGLPFTVGGSARRSRTLFYGFNTEARD